MSYPRVAFDMPAYVKSMRSVPCHFCPIAQGTHHHQHAYLYRDDFAFAFLNRFPSLVGHALVAPVSHREDVVDDFTADEYLRLQGLVRRVGKAIKSQVPTERLYVLSLGSRQGNRHVHWHLVPLPPGIPYEQQQVNALVAEAGYVDMPIEARDDLARRIAAAID